MYKYIKSYDWKKYYLRFELSLIHLRMNFKSLQGFTEDCIEYLSCTSQVQIYHLSLMVKRGQSFSNSSGPRRTTRDEATTLLFRS